MSSDKMHRKFLNDLYESEYHKTKSEFSGAKPDMHQSIKDSINKWDKESKEVADTLGKNTKSKIKGSELGTKVPDIIDEGKERLISIHQAEKKAKIEAAKSVLREKGYEEFSEQYDKHKPSKDKSPLTSVDIPASEATKKFRNPLTGKILHGIGAALPVIGLGLAASRSAEAKDTDELVNEAIESVPGGSAITPSKIGGNKNIDDFEKGKKTKKSFLKELSSSKK